MDKYRSLGAFFAQSSFWEFALNMFLTALLAALLGRLYVRYGRSLSNRRAMARNFVLLAMTTMLVITIVRSSLALSLGLIGALSIVRFRSAVKEPEELVYLFLAIAIGLGLGAGQRLVVLVAFLVIAIVVVARAILSSLDRDDVESGGGYLALSSSSPGDIYMENIYDALDDAGVEWKVRRIDNTPDSLEVVFRTGPVPDGVFDSLMRDLRKLDKNVKISFMEHLDGIGA